MSLAAKVAVMMYSHSTVTGLGMITRFYFFGIVERSSVDTLEWMSM